MFMERQPLRLIGTTQDGLVQDEVPLSHHWNLLLGLDWVKLEVVSGLPEHFSLPIDRSWHLLCSKLLVDRMDFDVD
jgi:hypothetical protein